MASPEADPKDDGQHEQDGSAAGSHWADRQADDDRKVLANQRKTAAEPEADPSDDNSDDEHLEGDDDLEADAAEPSDDSGTEDAAAEPRATAKETSPDGDESQRIEHAIASSVLKRFGALDDEAVSAITKSLPADKLAKLTEHLKKRQADGDAVSNEIRALKAKITELEKAPKATPSAPPAEIDALVKHFTEQGDETAAQLVGKVFKGLSEKLEGAEAQLQTLKQQAPPKAETSKGELLAEFQAPMDRISRLYPGKFDTAARRGDLLDAADKLVRNGFFEGRQVSPDDIFEAAAQVMTGSGMRQAQQRVLEQTAKERKGQISADTGTTTRGTPKQVDPERQAIRLLRKGHSPESVNRRLFTRAS